MDQTLIVGLLMVVVLGLAGWVIWNAAKDSRRASEERRRAEAEAARVQNEQEQAMASKAMALLDGANGDITKLPELTSHVTDLVLKSGERCYLMMSGAVRVAEAHRTKYVGGSAGVSFRVAKGVRVHTGSFAGQPVVTTFGKNQDQGNVYITNLRVVFTGSREVTSIYKGKLAEARLEGDHVWLMAENKQKPLGLRLTAATAPILSRAATMLASR